MSQTYSDTLCYLIGITEGSSSFSIVLPDMEMDYGHLSKSSIVHIYTADGLARVVIPNFLVVSNDG